MVQTSTIQHGWLSCCCTIHCWEFYIMAAVIWNNYNTQYIYYFHPVFFFCSYFSQLLCLWLQHRILQIDIDIIFPNRKYMKYWWKWKDNRIHHHLSYHQMMKMMIVTHHLQKQWEERQVVIKIIKYILKVLVSVFIKR